MADGSGREMARKIVDARGDRFVMNRGWNFPCSLMKILIGRIAWLKRAFTIVVGDMILLG